MTDRRVYRGGDYGKLNDILVVRLSEALAQRLDAVAKKKNITRSEITRDALARVLGPKMGSR